LTRPQGQVRFFEQTKTMEAMFSWYPIKVDNMEIQCFQNNKSNYAVFPSNFFKQPSEPEFNADTYLAGSRPFRLKEISLFTIV